MLYPHPYETPLPHLDDCAGEFIRRYLLRRIGLSTIVDLQSTLLNQAASIASARRQPRCHGDVYGSNRPSFGPQDRLVDLLAQLPLVYNAPELRLRPVRRLRPVEDLRQLAGESLPNVL